MSLGVLLGLLARALARLSVVASHRGVRVSVTGVAPVGGGVVRRRSISLLGASSRHGGLLVVVAGQTPPDNEAKHANQREEADEEGHRVVLEHVAHPVEHAHLGLLVGVGRGVLNGGELTLVALAPGCLAIISRNLLVKSDEDVVEQHVTTVGEQLDTDTNHGLNVVRVLIDEVVRVLNLLGLPHPDVLGVLDAGDLPLALVVGVLLHGALPLSAPSLLALGVGDLRSLPLAILLRVPVIRLGGRRVRNLKRLVIHPVSGLDSILIGNVLRRILVPVIGLGGVRVIDHLLVHPVLRLLVLGVINHLRGIDRRLHALQQVALLHQSVVDENLKSVVGADDKRVDMSALVVDRLRGILEVLLLEDTADRVLMAQDEVDLVSHSTTIRSKHDSVRRLGVERGGLERLLRGENLDVTTITAPLLLSADLVLDHKRLVLVIKGLAELRGQCVARASSLHLHTVITRQALAQFANRTLPLASEGILCDDRPPLLPVLIKGLQKFNRASGLRCLIVR
mmetsp:Transcript_21262/g.49960  ORF Transcript_21262/g.49960 Transcript_21262/m.49960 type:complete len:510 (+) Transcript_21262:227-1756(+)